MLRIAVSWAARIVVFDLRRGSPAQLAAAANLPGVARVCMLRLLPAGLHIRVPSMVGCRLQGVWRMARAADVFGGLTACETVLKKQ